MRVAGIIIFIFISFANFTTIYAQYDPFGIPDTLTIGSMEAEPNSSLSIPVFLFNDEQLMGMTIPLKLTGDPSYITCDSVIFNPDRTANFDHVSALIDNDNKSFLLGIIPSLDSNLIYIEPDTGLLCEIFITIGDVWESEIETLTTAQLPPFNTLKFVGDSITPFVPEFNPGYIHLNPTIIDDHQQQPESPSISIRAYPNPFNAVLNLEIYLAEPENYRLRIFNVLGQKIYQKNFRGHYGNNRLKPIDFSGQSSGIHFVRINSKRNEKTMKILYLK